MFLLKKEPGAGGPLVYAMCMMSFIAAIYVFILVDYRAHIHMLKDDMEIKLHIVENYCLTVNQREDSGDDRFERERERAHIITVKQSEDGTPNAAQLEQAKAIGKAFEKRFKAEFFLEDGVHPSVGALSSMSNHKAENALAEMHIESLIIYEPVYMKGSVFPVYCGQEDGHTKECTSKDCDLPEDFDTWDIEKRKTCTVDGSRTGERLVTGFWTETKTEGFWIYEFSFDDKNSLVGFMEVPRYQEAPPEVMGSVFGQTHAEGATIQATIYAKFKSPFGFFGEHVDNIEVVKVSEGIDIVFSTEDSRHRGVEDPRK